MACGVPAAAGALRDAVVAWEVGVAVSVAREGVEDSHLAWVVGSCVRASGEEVEGDSRVLKDLEAGSRAREAEAGTRVPKELGRLARVGEVEGVGKRGVGMEEVGNDVRVEIEGVGSFRTQRLLQGEEEVWLRICLIWDSTEGREVVRWFVRVLG